MKQVFKIAEVIVHAFKVERLLFWQFIVDVLIKEDVRIFGQIRNETLRHPFIDAFPITFSVDVFKDTDEALKTERKHEFKTEHEHFCVFTLDVDSMFCEVIVVVETPTQLKDEQDNTLQTFTAIKEAETPRIWEKDADEQFNDEHDNDELVIHDESTVDIFAYEQLSVFKKTREEFVNDPVHVTEFVFKVDMHALVHETNRVLFVNTFNCCWMSDVTLLTEFNTDDEIPFSNDTLQEVKYAFDAEKFPILSILLCVYCVHLFTKI